MHTLADVFHSWLASNPSSAAGTGANGTAVGTVGLGMGSGGAVAVGAPGVSCWDLHDAEFLPSKKKEMHDPLFGDFVGEEEDDEEGCSGSAAVEKGQVHSKSVFCALQC
jgi:hypothetical protein